MRNLIFAAAVIFLGSFAWGAEPATAPSTMPSAKAQPRLAAGTFNSELAVEGSVRTEAGGTDCVELNGTWQIKTDGDNRGRTDHWFDTIQDGAKEIGVPGIIQQVFPGYHGLAWYWRNFELTSLPGTAERMWLGFEAVDYLGDVWVNGRHVGRHEGGETPFELDITDAVKAGKNLVAVRVLNPRADQEIDGYLLRQTPRSVKDGFANFGGLTDRVSLLRRPDVFIRDVFVEPDATSGQVRVHVTARNDRAASVHGTLRLEVSPDRDGPVVADAQLECDLSPGESTHTLALTVPQHHLWDLDDPFLYRAAVRLDAPSHGAPSQASGSERTARFGFRDFRVIDGFFHLNGKRIFLRCGHTAPFFPAGIYVPAKRELIQRDLVLAKACGFNCVRFLSKMPHPEQLDLCDQMGLLVYEECYASWWGWESGDHLLGDLSKIGDRFRRGTYEMVLRDRNHPSVVIWGLLNESRRNEPERQAIAILPSLRKLNGTRLILLGSGRWDGQLNIGSVANPGSSQWEYQWGAEAPDAKPLAFFDPLHHKHEGEGDFHYYPTMPLTADACRIIRQLGQETKPVFLSECGVGSMFDSVREAGQYQQARVTAPYEDRAIVEEIAHKLQADLQRLGLDDVYPSTAELLRDSQRLNIRQRRRMFDLVRSNPNICGYSLTELMDGISGEGVWTWWRQLKPGVAECLENGWAPLRWCLFVDHLNSYSGRPLHIEAVLANEDVLPPGAYSATFRIWGPHGTVWRKKVDFRLPEEGKGHLPPLAVPVLDETIKLAGPEGRYVLTAWLDNGAAPADDQLEFHLSDVANLPRGNGSVMTWGVSDAARAWIQAKGIACEAFGAHTHGGVILVGRPADGTDANWKQLTDAVDAGAVALFLDPEALGRGSDTTGHLPLAGKNAFYHVDDWLYHKECLARPHRVFQGLPTGLLDWDFYDDVVSNGIFQLEGVPDETIAAAINTNLCGLMAARYQYGKGSMILNTFNLLPRLDQHPAADRLLLNFIAYGQSLR